MEKNVYAISLISQIAFFFFFLPLQQLDSIQKQPVPVHSIPDGSNQVSSNMLLIQHLVLLRNMWNYGDTILN